MPQIKSHPTHSVVKYSIMQGTYTVCLNSADQPQINCRFQKLLVLVTADQSLSMTPHITVGPAQFTEIV